MTQTKNQLLLLAGWLIVTMALTALIWSRYPDNHGAGYHLILAIYVLGLIASGFLVVRRDRFGIILALINLASITGVIVLNQANIFLTHAQWVERGMPGWGVF